MRRTTTAIVIASLAAMGATQAQTGAPNNTGTPNTSTKGRAADPTGNSAEAAIRERLRAAGLTGVHDLKRNPDGTWEGRAVKGNEDVAVIIDTAGNVMFQ